MMSIEFWILLAMTVILNLCWPPITLWLTYRFGRKSTLATLAEASSIGDKVDVAIHEIESRFDKEISEIKHSQEITKKDLELLVEKVQTRISTEISSLLIPDIEDIPTHQDILDMLNEVVEKRLGPIITGMMGQGIAQIRQEVGKALEEKISEYLGEHGVPGSVDEVADLRHTIVSGIKDMFSNLGND